jgi:phosphoglycolate phosphatase
VSLVVGFDLDLTLVDSRPGIAATFAAVSASTGRPIDVAAATAKLGAPLDDELARWFPAAEIAATADLFRALYVQHGVHSSPACPGAAGAIDAVRNRGGRVVVVTAKYAPNAQRHLDFLRLPCDHLTGWAFGPAKSAVLIEQGVQIYVGDTGFDMAAARAAGAVAVGVLTGDYDRAELQAAGADVIIDDLRAFPPWLHDHCARSPRRAG